MPAAGPAEPPRRPVPSPASADACTPLLSRPPDGSADGKAAHHDAPSGKTPPGAAPQPRPFRATRPLPRLSASFSEFFTSGAGAGTPRPLSGYFPHFPRTGSIGAYDEPALQDDLMRSGRGNGVRVGYESFMMIDWTHDWIKESFRLRRLRFTRGIRGRMARLWDRSLGWVIVLITGIVTAAIAGGVVMSEAVLFDLKEGYCQRDWRLAKSFCCSMAPLATSDSYLLQEQARPESCSDWVLWSDKLGSGNETRWGVQHATYLAIAVLWAVTASLLTVYLTSSDSYLPNSPRAETFLAHNEEDMPHDAHQPVPSHPSSPVARSKNYGTLPSAKYGSLMGYVARTARAQQAAPPRKTLYWGAGSGIGEVRVLLSGVVIHGYLGFWALFTKATGLALSVASGLNAGKEGPFVHMACCVGNLVSRTFPGKFRFNEAKRREIISCAAAAGVAVAFGAPVGGVLFSLEEISLYFPSKVMFRAFACAMTAALTLRAINPFGTGRIVLFQVEYDTDWLWSEMPVFLLVALFGGVYGAVFTNLNTKWAHNVRGKSWMARHPVIEVALITLVTAGMAFLNPYLRIGGAELISELFQKCGEHEPSNGLCVMDPSQISPLLTTLTYTLAAKTVLAIITFGIKLPAGIFIPSLVAGALFGRIIGLIVQKYQWAHSDSFFDWCPPGSNPCVVPGMYSMVGAAATLSGVTRSTVSLVVIVFELTGRLTYSIPVMLCTLIARTTADALEPESVYEQTVKSSGLPYLNPNTLHIWSDASVADALDMGVDPIWVHRLNTVSSLEAKLAHLAQGLGHADGGFPLLVPDASTRPRSTTAGLGPWGAARMVGYISAPELDYALTRLRTICPTVDASTPCTFYWLMKDCVPPPSPLRPDTRNFAEASAAWIEDPLDLSRYVDSSPIYIQIHTPLELVHQYFTKFGLRYLAVTDDGRFAGMVWKKNWIDFVEQIDKHNGAN